jgi:1-acyl-sn-glycerol-3-phosphate acyltransferase
MAKTRALGFIALYLVCESAGILSAAIIWLVTLGGRLGGQTKHLDANAALQRRWSTVLFEGAVFLFSMRVTVQGLEGATEGPVLLLVRHSSTADTVLAAAVVANPVGLRLRYVLKRELLWDPCLDIVGRRLPNAFVDRAATRRGDAVRAVAALGRGLDARSGVLIYPEGTRFTPSKLVRAVERLRRESETLADIASTFTHVLPPRLGGPLALMDSAPDAAVVFVEHCGFEAATTLADFWRGGLVNQTVTVRLRRFEPSQIPSHDRDVWLFERWRELDRWLAKQPQSTT